MGQSLYENVNLRLSYIHRHRRIRYIRLHEPVDSRENVLMARDII
jgi:hypothetical protein